MNKSDSSNQDYINLREGFAQNYPPKPAAPPPAAPTPGPKFAFRPKHSNNFMLILVAGNIVLQLLVFFVLGFASAVVPGFHWEDIPGWVLSVVVIQFLLLGGSSAVYLIVKRKHIKDILPFRPLGWRNVIMIVVLTLAFIPILMLVNIVSQLVVPNVIGEMMEDVIQDGGIWLSLVVFAVIPPFFEEIAFRGIGFVGFRHVKIGTAAIINGLVFGFLHMNMNQFTYAFLGGVIFCYLMYYTKSIWAPILSHFVINASNSLLVFFADRLAGGIDFEATAEIDMTVGGEAALVLIIGLGIFALFSLAIFIGIYILFKRHNLRRNEAQGIITHTAAAAREAGEVRPRAFTWAFWAAAVIFAMMMLLNYVLIPMMDVVV